MPPAATVRRFRLRFPDQLHINGNIDFIADHDAAGFEHWVEGKLQIPCG